MTIQQEILGMNENDAQQLVTESGFLFRIMWRDGQRLVPFDPNDHNGDRINVEVVEGKVANFLLH